MKAVPGLGPAREPGQAKEIPIVALWFHARSRLWSAGPQPRIRIEAALS
jgi:hypothetical protein